MAVNQTLLTAWKNADKAVTLVLSNGNIVRGKISDDGSTGGDDAIRVQLLKQDLTNGESAASDIVQITKSQIAMIPVNIPA